MTTHLPNQVALKMDGAQMSYPYPARVGRRGGGCAASGTSDFSHCTHATRVTYVQDRLGYFVVRLEVGLWLYC